MNRSRILILSLMTLLAAGSSFAKPKCDPRALDGTWTRFESGRFAADAGTRWQWTFAGDTLNAKIALTDNLTATGTYGPYYEKEIHSEFTLDEDCVLTLTAVESIARGYREFDEPTPAETLEVRDEDGKKTEWKVSLSADRRTLRIVDTEGKTRIWSKKP